MSSRLLLVLEASTLLLVILVLLMKLMRSVARRYSLGRRKIVVLLVCDDSAFGDQLKCELNVRGSITRLVNDRADLYRTALECKKEHGRVDIVVIVWTAEKLDTLEQLADSVQNNFIEQMKAMESVCETAMHVKASRVLCLTRRLLTVDSKRDGNHFKRCRERLDDLVKVYGDKCSRGTVDVRWENHESPSAVELAESVVNVTFLGKDVIATIWRGIKLIL